MVSRPEQGNRKVLDFFLPGMITIDGKTGKYPAISITGNRCSLNCSHCRGHLLNNMYPGDSPVKLYDYLVKFENRGMLGALITGGCDIEGRLPWPKFLPAIKKYSGNLFLSAHSGINVSSEIAAGLKDSGIKQALIDVIGDEVTAREIYNIPDYKIVQTSLDNLYTSGPVVIPHVIIGIYNGTLRSELTALDMVSDYGSKQVELIILMPNKLKVNPIPISDVVEVFRYARERFETVALGCARPRGDYRFKLEEILIEEGLIDRMALWSDRAVAKARESGYEINFKYTCCSVD